MAQLGILELQVEEGTDTSPTRTSIVLTQEARDRNGRLHVTPDCVTLDELEGQINALQDDLDEMRRQARRIYGKG